MFEILGSDAFLGPLRDTDAAGENAIFRGRIAIDGESSRCYIKPFPAEIALKGGKTTENRTIIGEALGHVLAGVCGFSVPRAAGAIILRRDQIPDNALQKLTDQTPGGVAQDEYVAWFSVDMRQGSLVVGCPSDAPELMRQRNFSRLATELAVNKVTPAIVSFDEWTENSDRHFGNLLGSSSGTLILIDHGRLFRHPSWDPRALESSPLELRNALKELIDSMIPSWSTKTPTRSARSLAYNGFSVAWKSKGKDQAETVLTEFMDQSEVTQVLDFLGSRLEPQHYSSQVGLII